MITTSRRARLGWNIATYAVLLTLTIFCIFPLVWTLLTSLKYEADIVTQTMQFIYEVSSAVRTLHRILAPGGVLLATVPGLTKISRIEDELYGEWWHFTGRSVRRLAEEVFGAGNVDVATYGNVLAASGFLYGLASSDLEPAELDAHDPLYEVVIGLRAVKAV